MFRAFAFAALACLPLPAAAQDMPLIDHVANMLLGLKAGSHVYLGEMLVPVKQLGPGIFEVSAEGQRTETTTITELEPCVFDYTSKRGTREASFQLHMRLLNGVQYIPKEPDANGMATIVVYVESLAGYLIRDGKPIDAKRFVPALKTDILVASLDASVAALKAACLAGDPSEGMELVDHLASVLLGFHNGYHVPVAGYDVPVIRTGPGVFEMNHRASRVDFKVSISQVGACLFEVAMESAPLAPVRARVDATRLAGVTYTPAKADGKMTTYSVQSALEPGFKTLLMADGTTKPDDDLPGATATDAPLELLEGSVDALLAACP